jgi:uncharacterized membrane protein YeaQ/YmgE (transglycosylase-associated protein family)
MHLIWFLITGTLIGWSSHFVLDGGKSKIKLDVAAGIVGALFCGLIATSIILPQDVLNVAIVDIILGSAGAAMGVFLVRTARSQRRR